MNMQDTLTEKDAILGEEDHSLDEVNSASDRVALPVLRAGNWEHARVGNWRHLRAGPVPNTPLHSIILTVYSHPATPKITAHPDAVDGRRYGEERVEPVIKRATRRPEDHHRAETASARGIRRL
jgi:hypothetical protein